MADGTGRSEAVGAWLIKAGVPLAAAALAAFIYARKGSNSASKASDEDDLCEESTVCDEEEKENDRVDEVFLGMVDRINELEARFERYQSMKECEGVVIEVENMLQLEIVRGDYLKKEVLSIEAEVRRMQELEIYGINLLQQVKILEQENRRLKKKAKKFFKKSKEGVRVIEELKSSIQDSEAMYMRCRDEVEKGRDVVNKLGAEMNVLQGVIDDLRRENMQLVDKLENAEASLTLKNEGEIITIEEYNHVINELEILQKEFIAEENELVSLRWTNACLRRQQMQREGDGKLDCDLGLVAEGSGEEHTLLEVDLHHELDRMAVERQSSSREVKTDRGPKIKAVVKKLKKWVEGGDHSKMSLKANKRGDVKSLGRHYDWDWVEEHVHGRKSSSSAGS